MEFGIQIYILKFCHNVGDGNYNKLTPFCLFLQLEARQVSPPFKPRIEDQYGLENFDPQFTNEPVQLTPDDS